MADILGKLFGSSARIKILRLFLLNPEKAFDKDTISKRSKVNYRETGRELASLSEIDLIRSKSKDNQKNWQLNQAFAFIEPLKLLLVNTVPFKREELLKRLRPVGRIKLIVVSGLFIHRDDSRTDLLVVGDEIKKKTLENVIHTMESEIGREISYGVFDTKDFQYRLGIYDKFVRDVLDYPHEKILDKLGL